MTSPAASAEPALRLPTPVKAAWGFGSLGTLIVLNTTSLLMLFFMTTVLGVAPALAGAMLFGAKLIDAVMAPSLGAISDRTVSRWGRRRPYLFMGALVCGIAIAALFNPIAAGGAGMIAGTMAGLILLAVGYTLFNVPYIAMPPEMTDLPAERTSILSWRIIFVSVGGLVTGFAPQLAKLFGGGRAGWGAMGLVLALAVTAAMLVTVAAAGRTRTLPMGAASGQSAFGRFAVVFRNRPFLFLLVAKICQLVGLASFTATTLFFMRSVLQVSEAFFSLYVSIITVASLVSVPVWAKIGRLADKRTLYVVGCFGFAAANVSWLLASAGEPAALIVARGILSSFFGGAALLMGQSLLPDTIDYDCRRSGERREGVYAGAYSLVEKASTAFGPLIIGLVLQAFGFQPGAAPGTQGSEALTGVYIGVAVLPPLLYSLSTIALMMPELKAERLAAPAA